MDLYSGLCINGVTNNSWHQKRHIIVNNDSSDTATISNGGLFCTYTKI